MVALERAGIPVERYYASEIEECAMKVSQNNYPTIIQLGDVTKWKEWDIPWNEIDLLIGGSPCQGFSIAGKKLNFNDSRSRLFFEFVAILNHIQSINPNVKFLLENVKMPDNVSSKIDELMGVTHTYIDSRNFTGMIRKRYYWTNIDVNPIPQNDLKIRDIINNDLPYDKDMQFFLKRTKYAPTTSRDGIITINPRDNNDKQTWQRGRVYDINGNCPTICASLFDLNISANHKTYRKLTIEECEKLQGLPSGYTDGISYTERGKVLGNGWTVDVISYIFSFLSNK